MNCPYCGARTTHNGDAYHCGTDIDGRQSKQCKNDSGDVAPFGYMPPTKLCEWDSRVKAYIPVSMGTVMTDEQLQELREILSDVLKTKGRVPNTLRARIRKFLGDE